MSEVTIVGAGFSGMSLAYFLNKKGVSVTICDQKIGPGGMISTAVTDHGVAEAAANGFLNTAAVETFLTDIGANYIGSSRRAKKRYIFRGQPRRWPLNIFETLYFIFRVIYFVSKPKVAKLARPRETVGQWSDRHFTKTFTDVILGAALQGIYAGDVQQLSASLVINSMLTRKKSKKLSRNSLLSANEGMQSLMKTLEQFLKSRGVKFFYEKSGGPMPQGQHLVIATSAADAAELLRRVDDPRAQANAAILEKIEMEPLISATCFFEKPPKKSLGFGILFPRDEGVRSLGVLMNSLIFERGPHAHSETWILGGATDRTVLGLSDDEIIQTIRREREKAMGDAQKPIEYKITRWPKALPHYSVEHEKKLSLLKPIRGISLHGNYLGAIGLSRLLERSESLAASIAEEVM